MGTRCRLSLGQATQKPHTLSAMFAQLTCSVDSARPEVAAGSQVPSSSLPSSGTVTPAASALAAAGRFGAEGERSQGREEGLATR